MNTYNETLVNKTLDADYKSYQELEKMAVAGDIRAQQTLSQILDNITKCLPWNLLVDFHHFKNYYYEQESKTSA